MSHELEIVNGAAQMAFVGELPWHGLGVQVADDLAPADMMKAAGVDWRVQEVETFAEFNGKKVPTGMKALIRETDGRVLTQVGKGWHPVQNEEAFEFFKDFTDAGKMKMHTAGSLKNGEIIWALAKVDDDFELFNGDKVESYMLFSNPHQYGKTIDIRFTPIRVVCNNTLTLSLNQTAANAVVQQPLKISMQMICPAQNGGGYILKQAILSALKYILDAHILSGGSFTVITPAFTYTT